MTDVNEDLPPGWLVDAIETTTASPAVRARMKEAGAQAFALARLRKERTRIGFLPLPLGEYLTGLARVASLSLSRAIAPLEAADLNGPTVSSARQLGCLAHRLGFGVDELLLHLRVGFAERRIGAPIPMLAAHRGGGPVLRPGECDSILLQLEREMPGELRAEVSAIRDAAIKGFREMDAVDFEVYR